MKVLKNKYYIRLNEDGKVIKTFSSVYEEATDKDILVGEGEGSQFRASKEVLSDDLQHYADIENGLHLFSSFGFYQLKYENGLVSKVSDEELGEDFENLPKPLPSDFEILEQENLLLMETSTELYEKTLELENQNIDLMLAITELYEMNI